MPVTTRRHRPRRLPEHAVAHLTMLQAACIAAKRALDEGGRESAFGAQFVLEDLLEAIGARPPVLVSSPTSLRVNPAAFRPLPVDADQDWAFYHAGLFTQKAKLRRLVDVP